MTDFAVRLAGPGADPLVVTSDVSGLRFKKILRGGHASVDFNLRRSIDAEDLEAYSEVAVYAADTGQTASAGRLVNPGKAISASGEQWEITAIGEGLAAMRDRQEPYILIDTRADSWRQGNTNTKNAVHATGESPTGLEDGVLLSLSESIAAGKRSDLRYNDIFELGFHIAAVKGVFDSGRSDANNRITAWAQDVGNTAIIFNTVGPPSGSSFSSTSQRVFDGFVTTDWTWPTVQVDRIYLRYDRLSSTLVAAESDWAYFQDLAVQAIRYGRDRQPITDPTAYELWNISLEDIIIDVWARWCPTIDVENAVIQTDGFESYEQVAWPTGVTGYDIFDQFINVETTPYDWAVWEKQDNGLYRAEFREMPSFADVRYVVTDFLDFNRTGGDDQAFDRYVVTGTRTDGRLTVHHSGGSSGPSSDVVRSKTLTFGGNNWDESEASDLAETASLDDAFAADAARVTIGAPILDTYTGRYVEPWEIDPGYNMKILGVSTKANILNPIATRGAAVFRTISTDYTADTNIAVVELNSVTFNQQQAVAGLLEFRPQR